MGSRMLIGTVGTGLDRAEMNQIMGPDNAELLGEANVPTEKLVIMAQVPHYQPELKFVSLTVAVKTDCMANAIQQMIDRKLIYCCPGMSSVLTMDFYWLELEILGNAKVSIYHEITDTGVGKNNIDIINREAQNGLTSLTPGVYKVAYIQSIPTLGVAAELKAARTTTRTVEWADGE
ncbi:hypothetical protein T484DRAFT_1757584 [Baffinella frigidus]|nr:hypothetical protein T484DRAFT_1757584 [Cryptophyta sp. CCMP2293]